VGSSHLLCKYWHVAAGFCCVATIYQSSEGVVSALRGMFPNIAGQWLLLLILKVPGSSIVTETIYRLRLLVIITHNRPATERRICAGASRSLVTRVKWSIRVAVTDVAAELKLLLRILLHLVRTWGKETEISSDFLCPRQAYSYLKQAPTTTFRIFSNSSFIIILKITVF
jgi:hypothetical protein